MKSTRSLIRHTLGVALGSALLLGTAATPLAAAATPNLYVLTNSNSIFMVAADAPALPATAMPVTGLAAGETLVSIDVRPQNGRLYGLATSGAGSVQLYHIDLSSGSAVAVSLSGAPVQFDDGTNPVPITGGTFGIDFNPTVDRVRVVTGGGLNFRMNPNNGALVDGDNGGAAGSAPGTNPDGAIKGAATGVDATAYTNSKSNATATTQYTLDAVTDKLYIQTPPNSGTQTAGLSLTLNGAALDFGGDIGLDIPSGVDVASANSPASGRAYALLNVDGATSLFLIDLANGAASLLGSLGTLSARDVAVISTPAAGIALSADATQLQRFLVGQPATVVPTAAITGITAGETLVGIDGRPATGQLFGVGINDAANTGSVYRLDPQTGVATLIGAAGQIAYVNAAGAAVDLPVAATGYGVDFNPTVDRIRVVTASGLNFRLNPIIGAPVDGDNGGAMGSVAGVNPDGAISGATTAADATAYTNNFLGVTGMTRTTQYTLNSASNQLFIQNPPNVGTQTMPLTVTLGGAALDFTAAGGFDIPPGVTVTTTNAPAIGKGYAALTVGSTTGLYTIDLATGAATLVGPLGAGTGGTSGLVVWSAPVRFSVSLPLIRR